MREVAAPRERPILFQGAMVRALLAGTKTQTRRIVKLPHMNPLGVWEAGVMGGPSMRTRRGETVPEHPVLGHSRTGDIVGPRWWAGDRLWVREAWTTHKCFDHIPPRDLETRSIHYIADGKIETGKYRQAFHMPRWASRTLLEVTEVRVQRLQDISEEDAEAEGVLQWGADLMADPKVTQYEIDQMAVRYGTGSLRCGYAALWDSINGLGSWAANPWVWAVSFRRLQA
jgi:hypothetical protein